VQEVFASFLAVDPSLFTLELPNNHEFLRWKPHSQLNTVDRVVVGLYKLNAVDP
jgi:hypothetical protein